MAVAERAPSRILAGEANGHTLHEQRAEGERLSDGPVDGAVVVVGSSPQFKLLGELRVDAEVLGICRERVEHRVERAALHTRLDPRKDPDRRRRLGCLDVGGQMRPRVVEDGLQAALVLVEHLLGLVQCQHAPADEFLDVQLGHRAVLRNGLVHLRLRVRRVVALVVAVTAVADEVDDNVLVECLAVLEREPGDTEARLGVVGVHVEDRGLNGLSHVGAVRRRARVLRRRGETDLVVDDDVHRPADAVAGDIAHRETLGDDALTCEGCITVDEDGKYGV
ncbi:unannotated protein [freshwater metagenome]|uniref:Unannotated protein n=1 Tax=freshwater metagenome TaxID=449393 RepID=A0A6J7EDC3_9ZZZZ